METHGVEMDRLATPYLANVMRGGKPAGAFTEKFLTVLPFLALGLAYLATQYAAHMKVRAGVYCCCDTSSSLASALYKEECPSPYFSAAFKMLRRGGQETERSRVHVTSACLHVARVTGRTG